MDFGVFVRAVCGESRTYGKEGGSRLYLTYLTQRLEYRFHTARVIGSNPIVGKAGRNPRFCQHDSKHRLASRSRMTKASVASTCLLPSSTDRQGTPLFFSCEPTLSLGQPATGIGYFKSARIHPSYEPRALEKRRGSCCDE